MEDRNGRQVKGFHVHPSVPTVTLPHCTRVRERAPDESYVSGDRSPFQVCGFLLHKPGSPASQIENLVLKKSTPSEQVPSKQLRGPLKTGGGEESIKLRMERVAGGCRLLHPSTRKCELSSFFPRASSARFRSAGWSLSIAAAERLSQSGCPPPPADRSSVFRASCSAGGWPRTSDARNCQ